jgi:type III secretory pathway component EscS
MTQAIKLACYSYTAGWLAGIFALIPSLAVLSILGLYSIYLLYTGIPILMKAPQEKSVPYTATIIVVALVIFLVISWISRAFITYPIPGAHM